MLYEVYGLKVVENLYPVLILILVEDALWVEGNFTL